MINNELIKQAVTAAKATLAEYLPKLQGSALEILKNIGDQSQKMYHELVAEFGPEARDIINDLFNDPNKEKMTNVNYYEVEHLDGKALVEMARKHLVAGANGIAVTYKTKKNIFERVLAPEKAQANASYYVYTACCKDRDLIETKENQFLIIKADTLSDDLMNLVEENELVILK